MELDEETRELLSGDVGGWFKRIDLRRRPDERMGRTVVAPKTIAPVLRCSDLSTLLALIKAHQEGKQAARREARKVYLRSYQRKALSDLQKEAQRENRRRMGPLAVRSNVR